MHKSYVNFLKDKIEIIKSFENFELYKINKNFNAK